MSARVNLPNEYRRVADVTLFAAEGPPFASTAAPDPHWSSRALNRRGHTSPSPLLGTRRTLASRSFTSTPPPLGMSSEDEIPQRQRGGTGRFTNSADGLSGQPRGVVRASQMLRSVAEKGGCPAEIRSGRDINACVTRHAGRVSAKSDPPQRAAMGHSWFRRGVGQVACALGISGASTIP
jgi:hypothetical protein